MTTFVGKSAAIANGTTSVAPAYPTGLAAGDLLVLCITNKYPTNKPTIPAGWTLAPDLQQSGGSGASGIDTGSVYCTVMTKRATGAESGSLTVTITSGNSAVAVILAYRPTAGKQFALSYCNGADNTAGTAWSVTGNVNPGLDAGDWVIVASAINTDGYTYLSEAISAAGTTWGTVTERFDGGTISGQDCGIVVSDHVVSTGPSTAAPVYTMTASSSGTNNPAGASCMLRLREVGDLSATVTPASDIWPKQPAPNANNFLDHFPGASLNGRWSTITSGTGGVTVTDSYVSAATGGSGGASALYFGTKLDKTKSQLWRVCFNSQHASGASDYFLLVNKATAPVADTYANFFANVRTSAALLEGGSSNEFRTFYFNAAHVKHGWDGANAQWSATLAAMHSPARSDDYYILGLEIDGPNGRFRYLGWCQTYVSGYTFDQGWRLFGLSNWVNFASLESTSDLWLVLGQPFSDAGISKEWRFEWVSYSEANTVPIEGWLAAKSSSTTGHRIRHHYSFDGQTFVPQDRDTDVLVATGAGWESYDLQAPRVVDGGGTDYLFYTGFDSSFVTTGIGVAKATHATPQCGPWTRGASNPIISAGAGESQVRYSFAIKDLGEPDANKRWKLLYTVVLTSDSKERVYLATAPDPPDTSTWTKQGQVLGLGGAGDADEAGVTEPLALRYGGQWEVWYRGINAADSNGRLMRATGTDLASLTKDGAGPRLAGQANGTSNLTANLTGRTATVGSTTGFTQDGFVVITQDNVADNYSTSRVRKVLSSTQVELYHGLDGFTTTTPAKLRQIDACLRLTPSVFIRVGTEWWFYVIIWGAFDDIGGSYSALLEQMALFTHGNAAPSGATAVLNQWATPVVSRGFNNDLRSVENLGLRLSPVNPYLDVTTRFRLRVTAFRDVATRFVLQAGAAAVFRDASARLRLQVAAFRDASVRLRLQVAAYRDVAVRLRLAAPAFRDATARLTLRATAFRDATARFRLQIRAFRDTGTRLVLRATAFRDATTRLRLQVSAFRDATVRLRLRVAVIRDVGARLRLRATAFRDVTSRLRLQVAVLRDAGVRLGLRATALRDATARLRLQVARFRDAGTRLVLRATALRDAGVRFILTAGTTAFRDATARLVLRASVFRDATARLRLRVTALRDAATRLRLRVAAYGDAAARVRLRVAVIRDAATRLRLQVAAFRDAGLRLRLAAIRYGDATTRLRVQVAVIRDAVTRLRLRVTAFREAAARVRLAVTALRDASSRFRLSLQRTLDAAIRVRLRVVVMRDGLLRFRLTTSTVSTVGRATPIEAGSGTARATDATLGKLTGAMISTGSLVAGESAGLST